MSGLLGGVFQLRIDVVLPGWLGDLYAKHVCFETLVCMALSTANVNLRSVVLQCKRKRWRFCIII
ncbi:hypothetical protein, partial [Pseudomonas syringae group genomosp. 7]|uniref:hypothetical protein n=1 Tax=Pseudomonas syringae group genomosp. 7 TaxID=251699 RepID=UPI00376FFF52